MAKQTEEQVELFQFFQNLSYNSMGLEHLYVEETSPCTCAYGIIRLKVSLKGQKNLKKLSILSVRHSWKV